MAEPSSSSFKTTPQTQVLVVDDHPMFRAGIVGLINNELDLNVCAEAHDAAQALEAIARCKPDLVLADIGLPDKNGLELVRDIQALAPEMPVLVISMNNEELYAERVLRAGGMGYIMKSEGPVKILEAVRRVLSGKVSVSDATSTAILAGMTGSRSGEGDARLAKLTDREFEVLTLLSRGLDANQIAAKLDVSLKTVDTHRMHIRAKLSLKSNTELIHFAARWSGGQV